MKLIVNPHKIEIDKSPVNEREIDITKCEFEFADEITNDYVKEAYFTFNGTSYKEIIVNNQCAIPSEVLAEKGQVEIGVVAFLVENEEEIKRYNPSPAYFNTWLGSLKDNAENSEPITPSEMEQFEQALNDGLNEVANVDIDAEQLDNGMSVTITNRYGEDKTVYAYDGEKGETGATPNIQIGTVVTGDHSEVTRTGTNENPIFNFVLEKGDKGDTGNGIANVTKTSTSGLTDTYTITFTNGNTTTFNVTNGKGITNIAKTSTSGLVDTYTITYNDNTTSTFTVTNGNGISSIEKTGTVDNVDTYTIYYTNGTTSTFTVTNSTVTNQEFEELKAEHEELVNTLPRVTGTVTSITLDNTAQYKMNVALSGNTSQVQYTGKNLFNFNDTYYNRYSTQTSITVQNNVITIANTNQNNAGYLWWNISVEANKDYTISYKDLVETTAVSNDTMFYAVSDTQITDYNSLSGNFTTINKTNKTVTISNTNQYIIVGLRVAPNTTYTISEIQLEQSSTATSYEPYVGGVPSPNPLYPQPIKKVTGNNTITVCGKNIKDFTTIDYVTDNGAAVSRSGQEYSMTSGSSKWASCRFQQNNLNLEPNTTYTFSALVKSTTSSAGSSVYVYAAASNTGNTIQGTAVTAGNRSTVTFTTPSEISNVSLIGLIVNASNSSVVFTDVMLEKNSTATSYEPYQEQTYPINLGSLEYCKIGNYSDEFYLDNGNWYIKKKIAKVILNGSENGWSTTSSGTANWFYKLAYTTDVDSNAEENKKSNYYPFAKITTTNTLEGFDVVGSYFRIRYGTEDTIDNYKTWLSTHNLIIYYPLTTPISEAITDTTLIEQLNNLYNQIKSYKGQTNIIQTNAELPFNIDASALYDLNNLISRVATLEVEV